MRRTLPIAVFSLLCLGPAGALDMPARKAGLWEIKMSFDARNSPPLISQHCIDAATDKLMNSIGGGMSKEVCSKQDVQRSGGTIVVDSVCKSGDATTTSHGVMSGNFDQAYSVKISSKREGGAPLPGAAPGGVTNMTIEAKWTGACKADQKPGDIVMANGMKINIRDMQNRPGAPPPKR